jgi:AraC-like DNA-binding protein
VFLIHLVEVIAYGIKELIERRMRMKLALKLIADGRMTIAEIIRELKR